MPDVIGNRSLRIAHVVAHLSPDGRYGGPLRVATDLANAQRSDGHLTTLVATFEDYPEAPTQHAGIPTTAFPAHRIAGNGFAGLFSLPLVRHVLRSRSSVDVVHVHVARDALTSMVALALSATRSRYVLQTHGMIEPKTGRLANWFDRLVLRRAARGAQAVLVLTEGEMELFAALGVSEKRLSLQVNGVSIHDEQRTTRTQVLFLARLHPRKGASAFAQAAVALAPKYPDLTFTVAGPDEGDGAAVAAAIASGGNPRNVRTVGAVAPEAVRSEMAASLLYVLPAEREPFGLTILEALSQSTAVLVHETAALAPTILDSNAGNVFHGDSEDLATAIERMLLDRHDLEIKGARGRVLAQKYAIETVSAEITSRYFDTPGQDGSTR